MKMRVLARLFDGFGILSVGMIWLWGLLLLVPLLLRNIHVKEFLHPSTTNQIEPMRLGLESPPEWVVFCIIALSFAVVLGGIWALVKAPKAIVKTSQKASERVARNITSGIARNHPLSLPERKKITERIVWIVKLSVMGLGYLVSCVAAMTSPSLSTDVALVMCAILAPWPVLWFVLSWLCQRYTQKSLR